jgi:hypothetical protein
MGRLWAIFWDWLLCRLGRTGDISRLSFVPADVQLVAVAVQRTGACTAHAGVAYRVNNVLRILHFANHHRLRDDPSIGPCAFAIPQLKEEDMEWLAGFCGRVSRTNSRGRIPYSFEFDVDLLFDRDTGALLRAYPNNPEAR